MVHRTEQRWCAAELVVHWCAGQWHDAQPTLAAAGGGGDDGKLATVMGQVTASSGSGLCMWDVTAQRSPAGQTLFSGGHRGHIL